MKDINGLPSFDTGILPDDAEYTLNQVGAMVGLSHNTIYRAVKSGALKTLDRPGPARCSGAMVKAYYAPKGGPVDPEPEGSTYMIQVRALVPVKALNRDQALVRAVDKAPGLPRSAWTAECITPPVDQFDL